MRTLNGCFAFTAALLFFCGCRRCPKEYPIVRVLNENAQPLTVVIKSSAGETDTISNLSTGSSTAYKSYPEGATQFHASSGGYTISMKEELDECFLYDVKMEANQAFGLTGWRYER